MQRTNKIIAIVMSIDSSRESSWPRLIYTLTLASHPIFRPLPRLFRAMHSNSLPCRPTGSPPLSATVDLVHCSRYDLGGVTDALQGHDWLSPPQASSASSDNASAAQSYVNMEVHALRSRAFRWVFSGKAAQNLCD